MLNLSNKKIQKKIGDYISNTMNGKIGKASVVALVSLAFGA